MKFFYYATIAALAVLTFGQESYGLDGNGEEVAEIEIGADGSINPLPPQDSHGTSLHGDIENVVNSPVANDAPKTEGSEAKEDPNCPSREHIIKCVGIHLDIDKDGKLSRTELESAMSTLPWYGKGILKLLGSTNKMMDKCDVDKDDYISMDFDMVHNSEKCLATCFKRKAFKSSFFPECSS